MTLGVRVDHVIDAACSSQVLRSPDEETGELLLTADAVPGVPIRITKYATYQSSRAIPVPELLDRCRRTLDRAVPDGFEVLAAAQRANLDRFWDRADVREQARLNPVRQQQAVRWNLYQIAQASWRAEGAGVPANGQADIVLAMFLLGNEFSQEQKRRNFDYYDPLTTGDSSLSACVQSIIAAEIGNERQALEYFQYALLMDLGNVAGNASDGVHIASAAGVWSSLVFGFGGVRDFDGRLSFAPRLAHAWNELAFSLRFCGPQPRVTLTHDEERYVIEEGEPLNVLVRGESHLLSPDTPHRDQAPASGTRTLSTIIGSAAPGLG